MSYQNKLSQYVKAGYSAAYIESCLWASFSSQHSVQSISKDVDNAISKRI
jgi:hypothetical protein